MTAFAMRMPTSSTSLVEVGNAHHIAIAFEAQGLRRKGSCHVSVGRIEEAPVTNVKVTSMTRIGSPPTRRRQVATGGVHGPCGSYFTVY